MADWVPIREAWARALYGPQGFYRRERPADHFRTSTHASPLFAEAMVSLCRRWEIETVVDVGAGDGELLDALARLSPELTLHGTDLRPRPSGLDTAVGWSATPGLPELRFDRRVLVVANEVLDNVPCDVVELDRHGVPRLVEVEVDAGGERLGEPAGPDIDAWLRAWWPIERPGQRAEVGLARDAWWAELTSNASGGSCVAIDYGHVSGDRPEWTTLLSFRDGQALEPRLDGDHDVTAHVAVDSVASCTDAWLATQREVLHGLGLDATRPPLALADTDPREYMRALSRATQIAELSDAHGLGGFWWIVRGQPMGA